MRVDGIDDVWTEEACRGRGHARQLLEATIRHLRAGDAALSLLYGIGDFYPKFGYATVGFDFGIRLNELDRAHPIPASWTVRAFAATDLPAVRRVYERVTAGAVGPAIRPPESWVWQRLAKCADPGRPTWEPYAGSTVPPARDECRVAIGPDGRIAGYFWRGKGLNYVNLDERYFPTSLVIGEVVADNPTAADAVLAACRAFAVEESVRAVADGRNGPYQSVRLGVQPDSPVAAAAQYQDAWSTSYSWASAGPMVRALDPRRLVAALRPELDERWRAARLPFRGPLLLRTDLGAVRLDLADDGVIIGDAIETAAHDPTSVCVDLPQTAVARLALGGFPPGDLLARLGLAEHERSARILAALLPRRHPYLNLADRP